MLVAPAADRGRLRKAREALAALGVSIHQPNEAIAVEAARLRGSHPVSLPKAYCLGTARHTDAALASFDEKVQRAAECEGIDVTDTAPGDAGGGESSRNGGDFSPASSQNRHDDHVRTSPRVGRAGIRTARRTLRAPALGGRTRTLQRLTQILERGRLALVRRGDGAPGMVVGAVVKSFRDAAEARLRTQRLRKLKKKGDACDGHSSSRSPRWACW